MLVLSRKEDQKIAFPALGITVQVLGVRGANVKLGVDAPLEVHVMRGELVDDCENAIAPRSRVISLPKEMRHELRNELNSISIALQLFKQEKSAGLHEDAEKTFDRLVEKMQQIATSRVLSREAAEADINALPTALLVEDQPNEREMLAGFLRLHGYTVSTATDGIDALEYLELNAKPSVILIDMRMPRCDGPTTIKRIRENPAFDEVRIFAVSGSEPEDYGFESSGDDVNGWFMKPLNPTLLVNAMSVITGERNAITV